MPIRNARTWGRRVVPRSDGPDLRERLGAAARKTFREHFLLPHMLEHYLDLFGSFETIYRLEE
jgi:trehalose synthase